MKIVHVPSASMLADTPTKSLPRVFLERHRDILGIV